MGGAGKHVKEAPARDTVAAGREQDGDDEQLDHEHGRGGALGQAGEVFDTGRGHGLPFQSFGDAAGVGDPCGDRQGDRAPAGFSLDFILQQYRPLTVR